MELPGRRIDGLPRGVVTFLMTDVVSSLTLWNARAVRMDEAISNLDRLVATSVAEQGGAVIKARGEGDSHFAVFDRASDAIVAGCNLQRELKTKLSDVDLSVRAAVHSAEIDPRDSDYFGGPLGHTARLRSAAHGGQIVVSRVGADLARARLPDHVELRSLGMHRLRDWGMQEIFQVCAPGLRSAFPSLNASSDGSRVMTVVYVDAPGSTRLLTPLDDDKLVDWHRRLLNVMQSAFDESDGRFFKSMGDGCIAAFDGPLQAVQFAEKSRVSAQAENIDVRSALHCGPLEFLDGDIVGRVLYVTVSLLAVAPADKAIIVTRTVADLLRGSGLGLVPLGMVSVGSMSEDWDLYAVEKQSNQGIQSD